MLYITDADTLAAAVTRWVDQHALFDQIHHLGLAVSGGADSIALFHLLRPLCQRRHIRLTILHLNHGLRLEAQKEAQFVATLAATHKLPFFSAHAAISPTKTQGSFEIAARAARLGFFWRAVHELNLDGIATGHQADDVAENLLLRLERGAGSTGLVGLRPIAPMPPGTSPLPHSMPSTPVFIRPLLHIAGATLRAWLQKQGLVWYEDHSNRDTTIPRNFVRHKILPHLQTQWSPHLPRRLCQTAAILRAEDQLLDTQALQLLQQWRIAAPDPTYHPAALDVSKLLQAHIALQRRVLRHWLFTLEQAQATDFTTIQRLIAFCQQETPGARFSLPGKQLLQIRTHALCLIAPPVPVPTPQELPLNAATPVIWGKFSIRATHGQGLLSESHGLGQCPARATLDHDKLGRRPLWLRARRPGDTIAPTNFSGTRKIQDIFTDAKIPVAMRDQIPLLVCADTVLWLPGYRVNRHFAVTATTKNFLHLTVQNAPTIT